MPLWPLLLKGGIEESGTENIKEYHIIAHSKVINENFVSMGPKEFEKHDLKQRSEKTMITQTTTVGTSTKILSKAWHLEQRMPRASQSS